jgi:phosphatidylglycerophosphate synthase
MYTAADWKKPPNIISVFRGLLGVLLAYFGISGGLKLAAGLPLPPLPITWLQIVIVFGIVTDKVDGVLARRYEWTSELGKVLERNVDGFFIFSAVLFESMYLRFPNYLLFLGCLVLSVACFTIFATRLVYGVWFIDHYVSTKFTPGYAYLLLILHAFYVPQVVWFDYFAVALGVFALADFLFRWLRWMRKLSA